MALTVTEKEHWKNRIARKISQAIEDLLAKSNPSYLKEVAVAARNEAIEALGIAELLCEHKSLENDKKQREASEQHVLRQLLSLIRGVDPDLVGHTYGWDDEVERAIKQRQKNLEQDLLAANDLGRQILKLRHEEDELLDTVWLATSPQQIRSLWQTMSELLAGELTPLQQQALKTPPLESPSE